MMVVRCAMRHGGPTSAVCSLTPGVHPRAARLSSERRVTARARTSLALVARSPMARPGAKFVGGQPHDATQHDAAQHDPTASDATHRNGLPHDTAPSGDRSMAFAAGTLDRRRSSRDASDVVVPSAPAAPTAWLASWTPTADLLVVVVALFGVVLAGRLHGDLGGMAGFLAMRVSLRNAIAVTAIVVWATAAFGVTGAYDVRRTASGRDLAANTFAGCGLVSVPVAFVPWLSHTGDLSAVTVAAFAAILAVGVAGVRGATYLARRLHRRAVRVVIAGTGPRAREVWAALAADGTAVYDLVAVTDTPAALAERTADEAPGVPVALLEQFLMHALVDEVIVALPLRSCYEEACAVLGACERVGVHAHYLADAVAPTIARPRSSVSGGHAVVSLHVVHDDWRVVAKRLVDVIGAFAGLVLLSPLLAGLALAVRATSPGPVLYRQERYGYRKHRFRIWKFRTMVADADRRQAALEADNEASGPVFKIRDDPRVTRVGAVLRRSSLDELPQLWNVLRGEMSLVGPRPLPVRDVTRFGEPWLMRRFSMRPGLTCLWQISGRSDVGFDDWVRLDLEYIDRWSLWLDGQILLRTVPAVLAGRGAH